MTDEIPMSAFPPFPGLLQNGYRLGGVLETLERTQVLGTADLQQSRYLLEQLNSFPGLVPSSDLKRADRLLTGGEARDAFRLMALHTPRIQQLHERYLGEMEIERRGLTLEQARRRPWREISVAPALLRTFESFRSVADLKLNWERMERMAAFRLVQDDKQVGLAPRTGDLVYNRYANILNAQVQRQFPSDEAWENELGQRLWRAGFGGAGGYWKQAGRLGSDEVDGRIYLSLRRDAAFEIWAYLARDFEKAARARGVEVIYKMSTVWGGFERFDSAVIYFRADDEREIYDLAVRMHRTHPEFFKKGTPAFAMPVAGPEGYRMEGLSFGQDPGNYDSFGGQRCDIVTGALRIARLLSSLGQEADWDELCRMFVYFLDRAGIDISNPAFEKEGSQKFPFLASLTMNPPSLSPASVSIDAKTMQRLIAYEIRSRYPFLAASNYRDWTERMAEDICRAWEGSGWVSEEIFDARMTLLFEHVAKNPRQAGILKSIRESDLGPRLVRSVVARLRESFPILKEPTMDHTVRVFAENLYRAWQSHAHNSGVSWELFEDLYFSRLLWMRDHLQARAATLSGSMSRLLKLLNAYFLAN